ncbi:alpha/beta hydrolase [Nocardia mexicana]|uniref:Alpha/beta hydrolase family protein n=1 Tax=Nocardia mexicana TaxID=279262 RepID=A0A370HG10_9NOCA|nr:alpha/beta hydrolase [Nocardia mexicana]RDI56002.1 alpha/beta hydrolase family protein [Nocardia mexicana]
MSDHLTVRQVLAWNPASLTEQANEWDRQATELRTKVDTQHRAVDGSHETFRGKSGDAMRDRYTQVYEKARTVLDALEGGRDAARIASLNFTSAKSLLAHQKQAVESRGMRVEDDGTCHVTEERKQALYSSVGGDENKYNTAMAALTLDADTQTATMKRLLDNAATTDTNAVTEITKAFADLPTAESFGNATTPTPEAKQPPTNGSPKENRAWWDSLTPQEQADMVSTQPASVGNLDGLPADVKDQANRNRIPVERARLEQEFTTASADLTANPADGDAARRKVDSRKRLDDLTAIEETLAPKDKQAPRKLMSLDMQSGRQGRAAVAVGDPDSADHVSVSAPGLGSNIDRSLEGMVGEADDMKAETEWQLTMAGRGDEKVSTIAWFGYDPPQGSFDDPKLDTLNVMWEGRAQEGAKPLADFYNGLDVASTDNDPHITALGHSYGSLTTSLALQEKAGGVDDVVFYGSPGLGGHAPALGASGLGAIINPVGALATETGLNDTVDNAGDLGLQDRHVYEMTEKGDPVANLDRFGRSPGKMDWVNHLSTDPITADGRTYTGASGHAEYPRLDNDTQTLHRSGYNLAAVVAGLPDNAINGGK